MRVLHVPTVDWQGTEGIARACRELATELDDCESYLVVDRDPGSSGAAFAGVRVIAGWTPFGPFRPAFARALDEVQPDIVHLHGGALAPVLALSPLLRNSTVVATCYSPAHVASGALLRPRALVEHRANVAPIRTAVAHAGGLTLGRHALRRGRVRVVCTPDAAVEAGYADAGVVVRVCGGGRVSERQAAWSDSPIVVFAGRAQTGRGVDDLIDGFSIVRRRVPGARLRLLLLPGAAAERWAARLATEPWAEVRVGSIDSLDDALAECQVGAFPFRWSATLTPALAASEAMAVGLPIVATAVGCLAPLVDHGVNGLLVSPNDPVAFGGALARVLQSSAAWQPLSEGARKTIEGRWSWSAAAAATRDAYVIARRKV